VFLARKGEGLASEVGASRMAVRATAYAYGQAEPSSVRYAATFSHREKGKSGISFTSITTDTPHVVFWYCSLRISCGIRPKVAFICFLMSRLIWPVRRRR
jgi:hypothetical protein